MTKSPTISVLIPTFRYVQFLPEAIESVLAQDFEDIEILISDDASGDGSDEVIRHYASKDRRIRGVIQPSNLGMVANWNWCLQQARGKYLKFIFGDDKLLSCSALWRFLRALEENPKASLAASPRTLIDGEGRETGQWNDIRKEGRHSGLQLGKRCLLQMKNSIGEPSAVMIRREALQKPFDSRLRQIVDLDQWLHLLRHGDLYFCNEPLCGFRIHPSQATAVNRRLGLGFSEHALLLNEHIHHFMEAGVEISEEDRREIFVVMHYAKKAAGRIKDAEAIEAFFAPFLSPAQRFRYALEYRLKRPLINLRLSLSKRLSDRRSEWSFATGWRQAELNS